MFSSDKKLDIIKEICYNIKRKNNISTRIYGVHHHGCNPFFAFMTVFVNFNLKGDEIIMKLNGEEIFLEKETPLDKILEQFGYDSERTAVELNENIVPKAERKNTLINNNDRLEVVSFVGGG